MNPSARLSFRTLLVTAAFALGTLPAVAHAACTPVETNIPLPRVNSVQQLRSIQGVADGGTLVRGVSSPTMVRLTGCSESVPTTVRAENVRINKSGKTVELAPWLISVNGVPLTTPKDLSRVSHEFLGNVTLGIQFVPVNLPPSLGSGQYSGPLILTFTD